MVRQIGGKTEASINLSEIQDFHENPLIAPRYRMTVYDLAAEFG